MWQPAGTHASADAADILAQQAAALTKIADINQRLVRLTAEVKHINELVTEMQSHLDGRPM